ncbi:MAG TPA: hypothetical protein VL475_11525 [Planctomycetaceae bacterium]|jgi:hypothetical protein|nr:hypothetical protein [Planctomycetaceae bacterium]
MWFTENPWPPIVILGIVAVALGAAWLSQKRGIWLVGAVLALIGCVVVFQVERTIVTEGERVEANVHALVNAFQKKDHPATLAFFSRQAPQWRTTAEQALNDVVVEDDLDVKDMSVRIFSEGSQAVSQFRANGTVEYKGFRAYHPSRWELRWQKEGTDWKIVDVIRLSPFKDERLGIFEARSN